ncbi:capsid protein (plasmid) [Apilactobacillus apisilvae]|uniref:Capsid protein n=1 Tax=Apilactobacillus apisilvae TaxID=2923364 RepID=A0ABY4PKA4_9LACO|nr:capsid protein [Apilactobacillus apisilvae]UQS85858.1 capsid protein [Apilactobacillus apisilvae]
MAIEDINVNFSVQYGSVVDRKYYPKRTSDALWRSPSNNMVKWEGLHVKIPTLAVNGGSTYRNTNDLSMGEIADYSNDWEDKQIRFARQWKTVVDPTNVKGTDTIVTISNITDLHNVQDVVKEQDCYMYSSLFQEKQRINAQKVANGELKDSNDGIYNQQLDETNILKVFDDMMTQMDESSVTGTRMLYVTPQVNKMLKTADFANRAANINGSGKIERSIYSIDDVTIVSVPSHLMRTAFDFTNGVKDKSGSKQIQMFMIVNGMQLSPQVYSYAGIQNPTPLTNGNYLYYECSLSDVFMLDNKVQAYAAAITDRTDDNTANNQPPVDKKQ